MPPRLPDTRRHGAPEPPLIIGLTGGIASGKSTVARLLEEAGFVVLDADREAHAVLEEPDTITWLVEVFGPEVLIECEGDDGDCRTRIDRRLIADRVFADSALLARLEARIHPRVGSKFREHIARARRDRVALALDVPLLFESGYDELCDIVIFVDASDTVRRKRARARGMDIADWERRERQQLSIEEKRRRADIVVPNDGDIEATKAAVRDLVESRRSS
ncbi:MAG: dephospho-CoA kinase [Planctomycetes bacterium]|nr:dephospho-CoA kinase [Planctomycetota bacterium]MCB9890376.1 dephospho-CoA kinase [Planctomycetota bacterium]MCB9917618.1 dephospho-CoA kinase [Planctomycetota bacterium]